VQQHSNNLLCLKTAKHQVTMIIGMLMKCVPHVTIPRTKSNTAWLRVWPLFMYHRP